MKLRSLLTILLAPLATAAAEPAQGLSVTFESGDRAGRRVDRLLALHVPAGQPATPWIPVGAFKARWEGSIDAPVRGVFSLWAETSGKFRLSVNGQPALEGAGTKSVQLNKGPNAVVAEFESDGKADAFVRAGWASKDFPREAFPPTALSHTGDEALAKALRLREGRALFANLNCAACHQDAKLPAKGTGMPEYGQNAPLFAELGAKFDRAWLTRWILDPASFRPHSLMPAVLNGPDAEQQAADLAAMLTQGAAANAAPAADPALTPAGAALFANLGCVGCHRQPDAKGDDALGRLPLAHVRAKWRDGALKDYLLDPAKNWPAARMPHFRLTEEEASQLAAYLLTKAPAAKLTAKEGDAARGAGLIAAAGCLNCHAGMPATTQPPLAKVAAAGAKGCLSDGAAGRGRAPAYDLSGAERAALLEFMKSDVAAGLAADVPAEFATRNLRALNCAGCHNLDGRVSSWKKLDEECRQLRSLLPPKEHVEGEPVPDAPVPALTWQGEKLKTAWMTEFIAGRVEDKPRWWLIGVMPGFTHHAPTLALGLGQQHGFGPKDPEDPKPDPARIAVGEKLLGMDGGFNCITCHDVGEKEATAVFEAPGINLALSAERLRKGHFHRWLLNPNRLDPETKMPKYADGDGMTQLTEHFNGKAEDQFEAIREYLNTLKK